MGDTKVFKSENIESDTTGEYEIESDATGKLENAEKKFNESTVIFRNLEITIKLTLDGRFVEITQVKVNKKFVDDRKRQIPVSYIDLSKYFNDDDEEENE